MKIAGSGPLASGMDPYKTVTDPQHCLRGIRNACLLCSHTYCTIRKYSWAAFKSKTLSNLKSFQNLSSFKSKVLSKQKRFNPWISSHYLVDPLTGPALDTPHPKVHSWKIPQFSQSSLQSLQEKNPNVLPRSVGLWADGSIKTMHKNIRIVEGNAECLHLKKLTFLEIFRQVFICLEAQNPIPPPLHTVQYTCIHIHIGGGERERRVRGAKFTKLGRKY